MTTFTINDAIFQPLRGAPGVDPAALQAFVNGLNQNPYANATFAQAVQRGDFVFELVSSADMASKNAGALYSNDRGTDAFNARGGKFAIQLDEAWFVPHGTSAATITLNANSTLGMLIHEANHSNNQALFDEAFKISITPNYRPELTGAARVAESVDLTMKVEVAGWYADLNTLRAGLEQGIISQGQYLAHTREGSPAGKLLAVEAQGKALGLSGDALTNYVTDHGKTAIPSDYVDRYMAAYIKAGINPEDVRGILTYAMTNDPAQVKTFTEEVGPDGTYISNVTYNNGDWITTVDTGLSCRVTENDGAHNHADYATRTTAFDAQGCQDWIDVVKDDGSRDWRDFDQDGSNPWTLVDMHFDAQGRNDAANVHMDDGSLGVYAYDVNNSQSWATIMTHYDSQGRNDSVNHWMDDGSSGVYQYDVSGAHSWAVIGTHYDAQGRNDATNHWMDDGSLGVYAFDVNNSQSWSATMTHYDAQGRNDSFEITMNDGTRGVYQNDVNGSQPWSTTNTHYDAQGRNDSFEVTMDDRTRGVYRYDVSGSQSWSVINTHFDAQGRNDATNVHMDDGSLGVYAFDVNNGQSWAATMTHYDAQGRHDYADVYMDDGTRGWYSYNVDGSKPYTQLNSHFNASGREDYANMYMADGSRNEYIYDPGNTHAYSRIETKFDPSGHANYSNRYLDDGSRLCVSYDYYAPGQHRLDGFNAAGQSVYLGCQIQGYVNNTVGQWNPAYGDGLGVLGFLPFGGGGGTGQQPGWTASPTFPDYVPPPQWDGTIEVYVPPYDHGL